MPDDERRCWTCRDRKIACGRELPVCQNCTKSSRACRYGLRASWPEDTGNEQRALFGPTPPRHHSSVVGSNRARNQLQFLNTLFADVDLHRRLADQGVSLPLVQQRGAWQTKQIPRPIPWSATAIENYDVKWVQYYGSQISKMVSTVSDKQCFSILSQMSFHDDSPSSLAVVQSICALSCLHQNGQAAAMKLYDQAQSTLTRSNLSGNDVNERLQSVMTAMFFGLFETFSGSDSSSYWLHVSNAKKIAIEVYNADRSKQSDLSLMLDWVYYHDVFTKFSLSHYIDRSENQIAAASDNSLMHSILASPTQTKILGPVGCSAEVLVSLSQIFDIVYQQSLSNVPKELPWKSIDKLQRRLEHADQILNIESEDDGHLAMEDQALKDIADLFRLAGLIYLRRAIKNARHTSKPVQILVSDAFRVLSRIETCDRTFPIFIVGCEARNEEQRQEVLRVFRATEQKSRVANVALVFEMVQRLWAQDDVDEFKRISYTDKITAALSTSNSIPNFT